MSPAGSVTAVWPARKVGHAAAALEGCSTNVGLGQQTVFEQQQSAATLLCIPSFKHPRQTKGEDVLQGWEKVYRVPFVTDKSTLLPVNLPMP